MTPKQAEARVKEIELILGSHFLALDIEEMNRLESERQALLVQLQLRKAASRGREGQ